MESQVENAIEIAWNPTSDQSLKGQAFEFLNQLRTNPEGRQACLTIFTRTPKALEVVRLVCLDVVNNAIQTQLLDEQTLGWVKDNLWDYVKRTYGPQNQDQIDSPALQNKLTQTLTYLFIFCYQQGWESFLGDFLALTSSQNNMTRDNLGGVILYLRLLGSIHDEIADTLVSRTSAETKRNTELKDLLRARDAANVATAWQQILTQWQGQSDAVMETTMRTIGKWVSWIDINLIVNQETLGPLFQLVSRTAPSNGEDTVQRAAIDTFAEIVAKKMKLADKLNMIAFLNLGEVVTQLVASPALSDLRTTSSYDTDLAESVARLVNNVMSDIVRVLNEKASTPELLPQAEQLLQTFLPLTLRFFSDEYDEICATVIPSIADLLQCLRAISPLPPAYTSVIPPVLEAIIQKLRYDETSSWGAEDEQTDEAEFQDLRKRLQILMKLTAGIDQTLYIDTLSTVVANTFQQMDQQGSRIDWRDLDLALHVMYLFGELTVQNGGLLGKSQPNSVAVERLTVMMSTMVQSGIATFSHPAIQLQYMEICVRYSSFFEENTAFIPQVLEHFVTLVHHTHARVRLRSWYLFQKFVKPLKQHVGSIAETVIQSIADLLPIKAEVPKEEANNDNDNVSSEQNEHSPNAAFIAQLDLFHAIGCISSTNTIPVEKQMLYVRTIMEPLFADMQRTLPAAKAGNSQALLQIHHIIMALGTLAHGFSDWTPGNVTNAGLAPKQQVIDEFKQAAEAILIALDALKTSFDVRTAARSSFSRLMGVLGVGMLPLLPRWIDGLLSVSSSKDEMAMFLRILDQSVFGFKKEIYQVLDSLLTPLLQRVFAGLAEPVTGTDDAIQLAELRREYLTFISVILNNDLGSVLVSDANQGFFEPLIVSVSTLAKTVQAGTGNLAASRLAFSCLAHMANLWGGPNVATLGVTPVTTTDTPSPAFPGFDRFLIERFHPLCWEVLCEPQFRQVLAQKDALAKQVLNEIAGLEQVIYTKTGYMFLQHLQESFGPGGEGAAFMESLTMATDRKVFAGYLQNFLKKMSG